MKLFCDGTIEVSDYITLPLKYVEFAFHKKSISIINLMPLIIIKINPRHQGHWAIYKYITTCYV